MDCDTTGIEPDFALVKFKKLAGGGYFKIINQTVPEALQRLGYSEAQVKTIIDYAVGRATLKGSSRRQSRDAQGQGFHGREARRRRGQSRLRLRHQVRLQQVDAG